MEPQPIEQLQYEDGWRCFIEKVGVTGYSIDYVKNTSLRWRTTTDQKIFQIWQAMLKIDQNRIRPEEKKAIIQQLTEVSVRHNSPGIVGRLTRFFHRFLNLFGCGLTRKEEKEMHSSLQTQNTSQTMPTLTDTFDPIAVFDSFHPVTSIDPLIMDPIVKEGPTAKKMDEAYKQTIKNEIESLSESGIAKIKKIEALIMSRFHLQNIQFQRAPHSTGFCFLLTPIEPKNIGNDPHLNALVEEIDGQYYLKEYVTVKILGTLLHDPETLQKHLEDNCKAKASYKFLKSRREELSGYGIENKLKLNLSGLEINVSSPNNIHIIFNKSQENYETFCSHMRAVTNGCVVLPKFADVGAGREDPNLKPFVVVNTNNNSSGEKIEIQFRGRFARLLVCGNGDGP